MTKSEAIQLVKVEIVAPEQQPRENPEDIIKKMVQRQVAEIIANRDDFLFQPFLQQKRISDQIKRLQTMPERRALGVHFAEFGCLHCNETNTAHVGCGMCSKCYKKISTRLKRIIRRSKGKFEEGNYDHEVRDEEEIAREAYFGEPKALPPKSGLRSQEEAAEEAGISPITLQRWLKKGRVQLPAKKIALKTWLWSDEDIARLKQVKKWPSKGEKTSENRLAESQEKQ